MRSVLRKDPKSFKDVFYCSRLVSQTRNKLSPKLKQHLMEWSFDHPLSKTGLISCLGNNLVQCVATVERHTHKVGDGPEASVLVLLQESHQQRADGIRLPWRQWQRLVENPIIHFTNVTAVERRLKRREGYKYH